MINASIFPHMSKRTHFNWWVIVMSPDIRVYECDYRNPHLHRNIVMWTVCFLTLMRHWDDGAVAATVRSMMGNRWLSIRQISVLLPEPPDSRRRGLSIQIDYLPCHYHLPCFVYILEMQLRHPLRVWDILLNRLYLYLWLYVDSCFTPCKYQSIKYYYYCMRKECT